MNAEKIGAMIKNLRRERGLTQRQLAEALNISDRTVSKWERGQGVPDLSLIDSLARLFETDLQNLLSGDMRKNEPWRGNMKTLPFFICPVCGNIITAAETAEVTCCGKTLKPQQPLEAPPAERLSAELSENIFQKG